MDDAQALKIISALADGVNPETGEALDIDTPFQALDVIRALFVALRALEITSRSKARRNRGRMPANAGKPWSDDEDRKLLEQQRLDGEDEQKLIQTAQQAAQELESLFEEDFRRAEPQPEPARETQARA